MSLEDDILIERFLNGELSKEERKSFLERVNSDVEFKEHVTLEKQLRESLDENSWSFLEEDDNPEVTEFEAIYKSEETQELKKTIAQAQDEYNKTSVPKRKNWLAYSAAASVLIFIAYNVFNLSPKSNDALFSSYLQGTDLLALVDRSDSINQLAKAQVFFDKKEYQKTIEILTQVVDTSKNGNVYLYLALSQIELQKYDEAEVTLNKLINSNLLDAQKGYWYKGLLYLKSDQTEKTKEELQIIIDSSYFKNKEAKKLIKKLK
ncbi:tetratricopeptide repeat protein [Pseudotenacibaculum sp. MALMAid0570]|uniref:tetratricopeptide repeat protein n=1 Tax=Pseudotenacibaculum sp. MALMAid0570 TaxID=3143938 RepID=UPI0032DF3D61